MRISSDVALPMALAIGGQTTACWPVGRQTTTLWLVFPEDLEEAAETLAKDDLIRTRKFEKESDGILL